MSYIEKKIKDFKIKDLIFFLLIIISIDIFATFYQKKIIGGIGILGDAGIYLCGIKNFAAGLNPYGELNCFGNTTMSFQYTPLSLIILYPIKYFQLNFFQYVWFTLQIESIFYIFFYSRIILNLKINIFHILLILFGFGGLAFSGITSGNISIILYGIIIYGIYKLYNNEINYYCLAIGFISLFKPYLLIFFLPGFVLYKFDFLIYFLKSIIFLIFLHLILFLLNETLYINYFELIEKSVSNEFYTQFGSGIGIIGILKGLSSIDIFKNFLSINFSTVIWLGIISILSINLILFSKTEKKKVGIVYSLILCQLINPYLMNYELLLLIPCLLFLLEENSFFNKKWKKFFYYSVFIFIIIVHDSFAPLFLISLFLFLIYKKLFELEKS